jgi:ethanolamine utilization protein EutQ (cupin superfamily)
LYYQPAIREATIQSAINVVKQECESHDSTKPSTDCDTVINKEISNLENKNQIPIGWNKNSIINFNNTLNPDIIWRVLKKIIGLGISGFAIMMGASFWFDFLKKLANVRNANPLLDSDSTSPNSSTK